MEEEKQVKVLTQDGERMLTEAETKRYYNLVNKTKELNEKGYTRRDCLLSVKTAIRIPPSQTASSYREVDIPRVLAML